MPETDDAGTQLYYAAVGARVRAGRTAAGLSQAMLAQRIGFTRSSIANLEAGRQRIALHLFVIIAAALGVEPEELLPDPSVLEDTGAPIDLNEHLAGTPETTHDFVRGAVAQLNPDSLSQESGCA